MALVKTVTLLWLVSSSHSLLPRVVNTGRLPSQALAGASTPVELEDILDESTLPPGRPFN